MANRLVSVDDNLNLPPAVQEQLVGNVRAEFISYSNAAATSASGAATSASSAAASASVAASSAATAQTAAEEAVAVATADLDPANAVLIGNPASQTREALDEHYLSASSAPTNIVNLADSGIPVGPDVTAAINALIASASDNDVLIGDKNVTYTLSGTLNITKPLVLRDLNFNTGTFTGTAINIQSSHVTLDSISIIGNTNVGTPDSSYYFVYVGGTDDNLLDDVRILNCFMQYNRGVFIRAEWVTNFDISGNTVLDGQYAGIQVISGKNGRITNNIVKSLLMTSPLVNAYGIHATDNDNTAAARSEHVLIMGNHVENVKGWAGIDTHSGNDIKIIANTVWNCWVGINVVPGNPERLFAPEDCIVAENTVVRIDTPTQNSGIVFSGRDPSLKASGYFGGNVIRGYTNPYVTVALDTARFLTGGKPRIYGSTVQGLGAGATGTVSLTFPTGLFKEAPFVSCTTSNPRMGTGVASITATGATLNLANFTTAAANNVTIEWRAEER